VKILLDACLSPDWVFLFREHSIQAIHWSSIGSCIAKDVEIFRYAGENGYVLFTHDLDFGALLAQSGSCRPSVIQARAQDISPDSIGESICNIIRQFEAELLNGALITLLPDRTKVRILPI